MNRLWAVLSFVHSLAGPVTMLLYPLYASVMAIESTSKLDDEQWLAYWILYSFLTLTEMVLLPVLQWVPMWYDIKLALVAWLVLPQFRGASYIYEKFVREKIMKRYNIGERRGRKYPAPATTVGKDKDDKENKFVDFVTPDKGQQEAY